MRVVFRHILLLAVASLMLAGRAAIAVEYPQVTAELTPESGAVGDRLDLLVSIVAPDMAAVRLIESFSNDKGATWTLVDKTVAPDEKLNATEWRRRIKYTIVPFEVGDIPTPEITVDYRPAGRPERTEPVPTQIAKIQSQLPPTAASTETPQLEPPKNPVAIPFPFWMLFVAGALVALALGAIIYLVVRKLRRRIQEIVSPPKRVDEWALDELGAIEREHLIEQKKIKEFYTRVSDTVRAYTGKIFHINALDLTTYELMNVLEEVPGGEPARMGLGELLEEADLVKFARFIPTETACRRELDRARAFVQTTRHLLAPPEEQTAGQPATHAAPMPTQPDAEPAEAKR